MNTLTDEPSRPPLNRNQPSRVLTATTQWSTAAANQPVRPRFWRSLLVVVMLCLWQGLPFSLFGRNPLVSYQIFAVITGFGVVLYIVRFSTGRMAVQWWDFWAIILFLLCVAVSANYNMNLSPQPLNQWLPNIYSIAPIIVIFLMKGLDCIIEDVIIGLIWTGVIASLAVIAAITLHLPFLSYYERGSSFSSGRIVLMKSEVTLTFVALVARLLDEPPAQKWKPLLLLAPTAFNLVVLTESRIYILASAAAVGLTLAFISRNRTKVAGFLAAPFVIIPVGWYIISTYFAKFISINKYISDDTSAIWRSITKDYFYNNFHYHTADLGFGFMSARPEYNNLLSYATNRAGADYGVPGYPVSLDDIGMFAALYQYGYPGLLIVLGMTVAMAFSLIRARKVNRAWMPVSAIGILLIVLMISPIPQNYFTIFATAQIGGFMWFVASQVSAARSNTYLKPGDREAAA